MTDLLLEVAKAVRAAVLPLIGLPEHRTSVGTAVGGDVTFGIDEVAENAAERVLEEHSTGGLAWYTEDKGLIVRGDPRRLVLLDPIDGTRPAGAGLESCVVAIASSPFGHDVTIGDVDDGLILEIPSGALFRAKKGRGVRIVIDGESRVPSPAKTTELEDAFWTYGLRGRPTMPSAIVLEELIDQTGVKSGTFDLGSAAFAMTRVVTGQLDAYVDHGQRLIADYPETQPLFEAIADGAVLNNSPYDVAAASLICRESGCTVTDAAGLSLDDKPLLGSGPEFQVSTLVTCTPALHANVLSCLNRGFAKLGVALGIGLGHGSRIPT